MPDTFIHVTPITTNTNSPRRKLTSGAKRAMLAATLGTVIEWYDYALYGVAAALVISPLFFPEAVGDFAALAAFATFAIGFFIRPVGGLIIAHLGDTWGRKPALIITIVLMGVATTGIGLLPTAAQIGIWAPIMLVFLRMLQGFGAGAELSGAVTVAAEYTPDERKGFFTGIINAAGAAGTVIAMLAFAAVSTIRDEAFMSWGWRLPFLASAVLFLLALYIRRRLEESPEYLEAQQRNAERTHRAVPLAQVFMTSPKRMILGVLIWAAHNSYFYLVTTFVLSYMTRSIGFERSSAIVVLVVAGTVTFLAAPCWGMLTDKIGAKQVYGGAAVFGALFAFPMFALINTGQFWPALIGVTIASGVTVGATCGSTGVVTTNLFPAEFRFSGVTATKEFSAAAIAGPTPFIATALVAAADGAPWLAALFIAVCCLVTVISLIALGKNVGNQRIETLDSRR